MTLAKLLSQITEGYLSPNARAEQFSKRWTKNLSELCDPERFARGLETHLQTEKLDAVARGAVRTAIQLIASHLGDGDHAAITDKLGDLSDTVAALSGIGHTRLFALTRAARTAGLFFASAPFEHAAIKAFGSRALRTGGVRGHLQRTRFALAVSDLEQAARHAAALRRRALWRRSADVRATLRYVDLANCNALNRRNIVTGREDLRASILRRGPVLVYGPGPTEGTLEQHIANAPVARVLMPGINWDSETDLANNRVDIAYANGETTNWVSSLDLREQRAFLSYPSVVFAGTKNLHLQSLSAIPNARLAAHRPRFIDGKPNMVPIIVWDLLVSGAEAVHVIGASFFLGTDAYRKNQLRVVESGKRKDKHGSTGFPFEVCAMLASHNALAGLRFAKNLYLGGRLSGDRNFTNALTLSDADYLVELDQAYGVPRR